MPLTNDNDHFPKSLGFTVIELIVVIAVMAILSGLGLVAFNQFNRKQAVVSTARMVISDLRLAQSKAYASEKPLECVSSSLTGYQFLINASNDGYSIVASCPPAEKEIKKISFPQGITVTDGFTEIFFKSLRQGLDIKPDTEKNYVVLQFQDNTSLAKKIIISQGGEIYLADEEE